MNLGFSPKVYILILNFNRGNDTVECLETIFKNNYTNYHVIVVDNNSQDSSVDCIREWAEGRRQVSLDAVPTSHINLITPFIKKPIPYILLNQKEALEEAGQTVLHYPLIIIKSDSNLGFAGGNNLGIRFALKEADARYIWILNNDTIIEPDALDNLVKAFWLYKSEGKKVGIIGSKLLFYNQPNIIQGAGGKYDKWSAIGRHIGAFEKDKGQFDKDEVNMDFVLGASMFVEKEFISDVGLMCEDYFLYFEEIDWVIRGRRKGWGIGYCYESNVFHKEGSSAGTSQRGERSLLSDYYGLRNRIIFTKKFYPYALWSVYSSFLIVFYNRIKRRQFGRLKLAWKALSNSLDRNFVDEYEF